MAAATHVAEDGHWSCEGSVPQFRGMPGQENEEGRRLVSRGQVNGIGGFWRGNEERGYHLKCK